MFSFNIFLFLHSLNLTTVNNTMSTDHWRWKRIFAMSFSNSSAGKHTHALMHLNSGRKTQYGFIIHSKWQSVDSMQVNKSYRLQSKHAALWKEMRITMRSQLKAINMVRNDLLFLEKNVESLTCSLGVLTWVIPVVPQCKSIHSTVILSTNHSCFLYDVLKW